jgi:hypothetical protein
MIKTLTLHNNNTTLRHIGVGLTHWVSPQCVLVLCHCYAQRVQELLPKEKCFGIMLKIIFLSHNYSHHANVSATDNFGSVFVKKKKKKIKGLLELTHKLT